MVPGAVVSFVAEGLFEKDGVETGVGKGVDSDFGQRPGVGGPEDSGSGCVGDVVEKGGYFVRGFECANTIGAQHDRLAGLERCEGHRVIRAHPVSAGSERVGWSENLERFGARRPGPEQQCHRAEVIRMRMRQQDVFDVCQRATESRRGARYFGSTVQQDAVVQQGSGVSANGFIRQCRQAGRASAERVRPTVGSAGAEHHQFHQRVPSCRIGTTMGPLGRSRISTRAPYTRPRRSASSTAEGVPSATTLPLSSSTIRRPY